MVPQFTIYLINVKWSVAQTVVAITTARAPLMIEETDGVFCTDSVIYPTIEAGELYEKALSAQIAIRSEERPQIVMANGVRQPMQRISDPINGGDWWIELGDWRSFKTDGGNAGGYYDAPSCRHPGMLTIEIGDQTCFVSVCPSDLNSTEFETLVSDFQDELFDLLVKEDSVTSIPGWRNMPVLVDPLVPRYLDAFVRHINNILKEPSVELREGYELKTASKARPVTRTFLELAQRDTPTKLTSKAHHPSYNTRDNRYLTALVDRMYQLVARLFRSISQKLAHLQHQCEQLRSIMSELDFVIAQGQLRLDEDILESEIEHIQATMSEQSGDRNRQSSSMPLPDHDGLETLGEIEFHVKQISTRFDCSYAVDWKTTTDLNYDWGILDLTMVPSYIKDIEVGRSYRGLMQYECKKFGRYIRVVVRRISHLVPLSAILDKDLARKRVQLLQQARKRVIGGKYIFGMRKNQIDEIVQERRALERRRNFFEAGLQEISVHVSQLGEIQLRLSSLRTRFQKLGIKPNPHFPASIIFVHNPNYRGALVAFRQVIKRGKIDERLLTQILAVSQLGVLDMPSVYERWCLLKIMRVLTEQYHFRPTTSEWRQSLVAAVGGRSSHQEAVFACSFDHARLATNVELRYQSEWQNSDQNGNTLRRYRPDFILLFKPVLPPTEPETASETVLVLDAKCKRYSISDFPTLSRDIQEVVGKYSRANKLDRVFVIHPSRGAVKKPRTTQPWSRSSAYGGSHLFEWEEDYPEHFHGGILLRPRCLENYDEDDNLKRLIGMMLEIGVEYPTSPKSEGNSPVKTNTCCFVCGGVEIHYELKSTQGGYTKSWFTCLNDDCLHFFVKNHCFSCRRSLFKHGSYWTYHDLDPLDAFHIRCPYCGACFVEKYSNQADRL